MFPFLVTQDLRNLFPEPEVKVNEQAVVASIEPGLTYRCLASRAAWCENGAFVRRYLRPPDGCDGHSDERECTQNSSHSGSPFKVVVNPSRGGTAQPPNYTGLKMQSPLGTLKLGELYTGLTLGKRL